MNKWRCVRDPHESLAERPIPRNDAGLRGWKPRAVIPALLRSGFRSDTSPPSGSCPGTVVAHGEQLPRQPLALIGVTDVPDRDRSGAAANVLTRREIPEPRAPTAQRERKARSMRTLRTRSIGTKVTDQEYARIEPLADGQKMSEWVRTVLLDAATRRAAEPVILAELLALRTILLNLHFAAYTATPLTPDAMRQLIDRADHDKLRDAHDRLAEALARGPRR